jgi:hypothetical protein
MFDPRLWFVEGEAGLTKEAGASRFDTLAPMTRTKAEKDGILFLRMGVFAFVLIAIGARLVQHDSPMDVRIAHSSARCLIYHCDPYNADDVVRMYLDSGGPPPADPGQAATLQFESLYVYLPTIFIFTAPIAALPFTAFFLVWVTLVAGSFLIASLLIWDIGKLHAPLLTGALLGFYLANSSSIITTANPGGLAVSLCIISLWCCFRERFAVAAVLCLAASLAIKPHDVILVWLFLIAIGGTARKRALQSLAVYVGVSAPMLLWFTHFAPHWAQELHFNLVTLSYRGAVSDPGPSTVMKRGALMITNLQSAVSLIRDDPHFYNLVTYAVSLLLLVILLLVSFRSKAVRDNWSGAASIGALTLLPMYHRLYDSKLLMLAIPACAIFWKKGGWVARLSLCVTAMGLVVTADLPWAFYLVYAANLHLAPGILHELLIASIAAPIPITLLVVTIFYLWAQVKSAKETQLTGSSSLAPHAMHE